jgi:hypothetical protein
MWICGGCVRVQASKARSKFGLQNLVLWTQIGVVDPTTAQTRRGMTSPGVGTPWTDETRSIPLRYVHIDKP